METKDKIIQLAKSRFDETLVNEFIKTYDRHSGISKPIDSLIQISTDKGEELEIGFFTSDIIVDITLSRGKVYSYAYPLIKVKNLSLIDTELKWVLIISGEKKFDYNVVKPGSIDKLVAYEASLREQLSKLERSLPTDSFSAT